MKIKITADSTCDLSKELIEKYDIGIMPLHVALGDNDCLDGVTIQPSDIYAYYASAKKLPRSGARSSEEYREFFKSFFGRRLRRGSALRYFRRYVRLL